MLDVAIIGCGVVGAAAAYELSHYPLHVAVLEAENDVADGTTKANSAILHAGYDPEPGTQMARLNVQGVALAKEICARLDVPYRQCGSLVLALKHGDRMDLARPAGAWMAKAAQPILKPGMLVVPVPLHWFRLFRRKYNQAALLSKAVARLAGLAQCPDALIRRRPTGTQDGKTRDGRFANLIGAFLVPPRREAAIRDRDILLVDDVMTSGATFAAATEALVAAGAASVSVLSLARVAKDR